GPAHDRDEVVFEIERPALDRSPCRTVPAVRGLDEREDDSRASAALVGQAALRSSCGPLEPVPDAPGVPLSSLARRTMLKAEVTPSNTNRRSIGPSSSRLAWTIEKSCS